MKCEYVLSGLCFSNIHLPFILEHEHVHKILGMLYKHSQSCSNHDISVLFNAYQELRLVKPFNQILKNNIRSIFSDSGGLQVITQGKAFDEKMKKKIYTLQAQNSDFAMAFDEIPVESLYNSQQRVSVTTKEKVFLAHRLEEFALKTRNNLLEQCDVFSRLNTSSKIFPIIQGNCLETYTSWYQILFDQFPSEFKPLLGGIAFSMAAFGVGVLEEIERIVIIEKIIKDFDHIHFLGMGSINRLLPLLILQHSGFLKNINRFSYDSTTLTGKVPRGEFFSRTAKKIIIGRHVPSKNVSLVLENIFEYFAPLLQEIDTRFGVTIGEEEMFYHVCSTSLIDQFTKYQHKHFNSITLTIFILTEVLNFTKIIDQFQQNKSLLQEYVAKKQPLLLSLFEVKSSDDFYEWKKIVKHLIPSQQILSKQQEFISLETFF